MRSMFAILGNWRAYPIAALAFLSLLLLGSDNAGFAAFLLSKAAGLATMVGCLLLGRRWRRKGLLPELDDEER